MKRAILMLGMIMALVAIVIPASATSVLPGTTVVATPGLLPPAGDLVATTGVQSYSFTPGNSGTYVENVYNVGGLEYFAYQVSVSTGDISQLSSGQWGAFLVDATQTLGGVASNGVHRTGSGNTIDIQWDLIAGQTSSWVILQAGTSYKAGFIGLQDTGASGTMKGFVAATPEPATMSLLGFGILGLGALRKKLRK